MNIKTWKRSDHEMAGESYKMQYGASYKGKQLTIAYGESPIEAIKNVCDILADGACKCPQGSLCEFFNKSEQCQYGKI